MAALSIKAYKLTFQSIEQLSRTSEASTEVRNRETKPASPTSRSCGNETNGVPVRALSPTNNYNTARTSLNRRPNLLLRLFAPPLHNPKIRRHSKRGGAVGGSRRTCEALQLLQALLINGSFDAIDPVVLG